MIAIKDLKNIWKRWFKNVSMSNFNADNPGWYNEYRDLVAEIMKIKFKTRNNTTGNQYKVQKVLKYYDPLTRDFHVFTFSNIHACESLSLYRIPYNIPANNLDHPYYKLRNIAN